MAHEYGVNDAALLEAEFRQVATGQLTDPTTVTLKVRDPSGTVATYTYALAEITRLGAGRYEKEVTLDEAGLWAYKWVGTGAVKRGEEGTIQVKASAYGLDA